MALDVTQLWTSARSQSPGHAADARRSRLCHRGRPAGGGGDRRRDGGDALDLPPRRGETRGVGAPPDLRARRLLLERRRDGAGVPGHPGVPAGGARRRHRAAHSGIRPRRDGGPAPQPGPGSGSRDRRHRLRLAADRGGRRGRRGGGARERRRPADSRELALPGAGLRRPERGTALDLPHDSPRGGVRQRHLGERQLALHRERRGLGVDERRPRTRAGLSADRGPDRGLLRGSPSRRQPVLPERRGARRSHRGTALALPDGPPPDLGLRPPDRPGAPRPDRGRPGDPRPRPGDQAGVHLRARPPHRRAGLADRGTSDAGIYRAGREDGADPAVPHQAAALPAAGGERGRPDRSHPGAQGNRRSRSRGSTRWARSSPHRR